MRKHTCPRTRSRPSDCRVATVTARAARVPWATGPQGRKPIPCHGLPPVPGAHHESAEVRIGPPCRFRAQVRLQVGARATAQTNAEGCWTAAWRPAMPDRSRHPAKRERRLAPPVPVPVDTGVSSAVGWINLTTASPAALRLAWSCCPLLFGNPVTRRTIPLRIPPAKGFNSNSATPGGSSIRYGRGVRAGRDGGWEHPLGLARIYQCMIT